MSYQEDFDRVFLGLKSQGFQKAHNTSSCVLLDDKGRRCAIGWLPNRPNNEASRALLGSEALFSNPQLHNFHLQLQMAHDGAFHPMDMERRLLRVADLYGLTVPAERGDLLDELVREWTTEDPGFPEKLRRAEADRKQTTKEKTDDA